MTSKLEVGAPNDSIQSALATKDDDETISIDEETVSIDEETMSRWEEEAKLRAVGGIVSALEKPWKSVPGKPRIMLLYTAPR